MTESPPNPEVLIVDFHSNYLSRQLPGLFVNAGARVALAAPAGAALHASRHVHRSVPFDSDHVDAVAQLEGIVSQLRPAMLVVIHERLLERIASTDPAEIPRTISMVCLEPSGATGRAAFHEWASRHGLAVPAGKACRTFEEALALLERWGTVFLKRDGSSGGSGVRRIENPESMNQAWDGWFGGRPMLVQRALDGEVGVVDMIVKNGDLLSWTASTKWMTNGRYGPSVARKLVDVPGLGELVEATALATRFNGFCGFDWVLDPDSGRPQIIEFHPRPPSGFGLGIHARVDHSRSLAALLGIRPPERQSPDPAAFREKPVCCYFPDHPVTALRQRSLRQIAMWLPGSGVRTWSMVPWSDPVFLAHSCTQAVLRLLRHIHLRAGGSSSQGAMAADNGTP